MLANKGAGVKSEHEYYDGQYVEEEYVEFGRVGGVKAIA